MQEMLETRVQSLSQEDLQENAMATHSSILAWKIPWTEEPGRLQSMQGSQRVRHDWAHTHTHTHTLSHNSCPHPKMKDNQIIHFEDHRHI